MEYVIDENRRSGFERRQENSSHEGRRGIDRRAVVNDQTKYISLIQKIPLFKGLTLNKFKEILRICSKQSCPAKKAVIDAGSESTKMFILIKGELKVVFPGGRELSRIKPVQLVGEMGIFTGDHRSASVVAADNAIVMAISKKEIMNLLKNDSELGIHILTNVITDVSSKLKKSNSFIDSLKEICDPDKYAEIMSRS